MKQISIQITDETARQIARLAEHWGLAPERHNTAVIERAVATLFMFEIGTDEYRTLLHLMQRTNRTQIDELISLLEATAK